MNDQEIENLYDLQCLEKPSSWEASFWHSEDDQYGRFIVLSQGMNKDCSVLDIGCGQGDFANYLKTRKITGNYKGIDISAEMISRAKNKFPQSYFEKINFDDYPDEEFDFVTAIGSFNLKHSTNQYDYLEKKLEKGFSLCRQGFFLSLTCNPAMITISPDDITFMYSPEVVHQIVGAITPYYSINTASLPLEMIVRLYKSN